MNASNKCLTEFNSIYREVVKKVNTPLITSEYPFEILPAMQIVAHYFSHSVKNKDNAVQFRDALTDSIFNRFGDRKNYNRHMYRERMYQVAFQDATELRWEWNFNKKDEDLADNAVLRVGSMLLDVLFNPTCIDEQTASDETYIHDTDAMINHYLHAPLILRDVTDYFTFQLEVAPIIFDALLKTGRIVLEKLS